MGRSRGGGATEVRGQRSYLLGMGAHHVVSQTNVAAYSLAAGGRLVHCWDCDWPPKAWRQQWHPLTPFAAMVIGRPRLVYLRGPFWFLRPDVLSTLLRRCRTRAALGAMRRVIPGPHTAVWRYMLRAGILAGRRIIACGPSHAGQGRDATGPQPILWIRQRAGDDVRPGG